MADYKKTAEEVLSLVGGADNVKDVYHCATRLRFTLRADEADIDALKSTGGVINVLGKGTQIQVVIGQSVDHVYDELIQLLPAGAATGAAADDDGAADAPLLDRVFNVISGIFAPYLPVLMCSGIVSGLLTLAANQSWIDTAGGAYAIYSAASNALFYFFPVLLSFTAAKQFHCNQYVAAIIGATLIHPTFAALADAETAATFLGMPVVMTSYASSVIPPIAGVWLYSVIEHFLQKRLAPSIQNLVITLVAILVVVPVTIMVFGPLGTSLSNLIGDGLTTLVGLNPVLAGIIGGGLCGYLAVFGLQWGLIPVIIVNIANQGFDTFTPMWVMANYAQVGLALGVFLRTRDADIKQLAATSAVTGLFTGITEPIIYGLLTKYKKLHVPFIVGGAVGGAYCGLMGVKAYAFLFAGILNFPGYFGDTFVHYVVALVLALAVSCGITVFLGYEDKQAA